MFCNCKAYPQSLRLVAYAEFLQHINAFCRVNIAGIYRNGRVELKETPQDMSEDTQVIVTFLNENEIDLQSRDINKEDASELLSRLAPFTEDWNSPEMDVYDNYDTAKSNR